MVTQNAKIPDRLLRGRSSDDEDISIHRDDADIVALFFALDTQWNRHPFTGQRIGLDYPAIKPTAELAGIEIGPDTLRGLRVMEHAAIATFAEAAK